MALGIELYLPSSGSMRGINGSGTTYSSSGTRKRTIIFMDLSRNMISPESANTDKKSTRLFHGLPFFVNGLSSEYSFDTVHDERLRAFINPIIHHQENRKPR
jgi:hypothetical protein